MRKAAQALARELREVEYNVEFFAQQFQPKLIDLLAHYPMNVAAGFDQQALRDYLDGALEHGQELSAAIGRLRALIDEVD